MTATVSERTKDSITIKDVQTNLKPFGTGQAAFNWARKLDANNVTVLVKDGRRYNGMTLVKVGDHYEGR